MKAVKTRDFTGMIAFAALLALVASLGLAGCGSGAASSGSVPVSLKDGTYTATSSVYEDSDIGSGYGEITITVADGKIADAQFLTYEPDGTLKGEDYGRTANGNQDFYNKAQKAVAACDTYAEQLVATGDPAEVDVISGATISYDEFREAADAALADAAK